MKKVNMKDFETFLTDKGLESQPSRAIPYTESMNYSNWSKEDLIEEVIFFSYEIQGMREMYELGIINATNNFTIDLKCYADEIERLHRLNSLFKNWKEQPGCENYAHYNTYWFKNNKRNK